MKSSGIIKVIVVVVGILLVAGLVYYFAFSPGKKYDRLISKANEHYEETRYEDAKKLYSEALQIRAEEAFPKKRIFTIDSIQKQLELDLRYEEKINTADQLYSQGKYLEANQYYFDALNIKPDEDYPVNQIKKIQEKLSDGDQEGGSKGVADDHNFHVVVGVFEKHSNALKMQERMKELGKESHIIPRPGNMEAVTYGSYDNIHTAYNFLKNVTSEVNEEAWVLYHETK